MAGDGFLRFSMIQNVIFGWVPDGALKRIYGALAKAETWLKGGADEITDVITCPGAYSCNLGLTKDHGLGPSTAKRGGESDRSADPQAAHQTRAAARIRAASIGWATSVFYCNARRSMGRME